MMDHKAWLWKKNSKEKTTAFEKLKIGKEEKKPFNDKAEEERDLTVLNNELSVVVTEQNAKDDFARQQAEVAHEAVAGWEKAEAEAKSLKQELDKAIKQRDDSKERLTSMNTSLEKCMQQLHFVREEQKKRIHDAMITTSRDYEKMISVLELRLTETSKRLGILGVQNTELSKALLAKEKAINDLQEHKVRSDADIVSLMTRLNSMEKENASLIYEIRVVEKELQIRNEERNSNRQTAEVTHKQHLESVKKIAKLESECQRLRILVKKRLPGPAAVAKMKIEVGMLVRDPAETRRRRSTSLTGSVDFAVNAPGTLTKRASNIIEQSYPMEEENMNFKETLSEKPNDYNHSQGIYGSTISRLSEVESPEGQAASRLAAYDISTMHKHSQASMLDMGSNGKHSHAESQSSTLISDSEYLRNEKTESPSFKTVEGSEMDLMDDFVEMEKLAIYSGDKSFSHSDLFAGAGKTIRNNFQAQSAGDLVTVSHHNTDCYIPNKGVHSKNIIIEEIPSWMNGIVKVLLEQSHVTHRNLGEILDDIKVALANMNPLNSTESVNPKECSHPNGSGNISLNPPSKTSITDALNILIVDDTSLAKKSNQKLSSELSKSVRKMIELVNGISLPSPEYCTPQVLSGKDDCSFPCKISETPTDYMVRVFQWKTSDLSFVLQKFIQICNDVLNEKVDFENLTDGLTFTLEWIINHCFSLQDVSSMRDAFQKHFDWDESRSESEIEGATINRFPEADKLQVPVVSNWKSRYNFSHMEEPWLNAREESIRLRNDFLSTTSAKEELEGRLQSEITKTESLMFQIRDSKKTIEGLQAEVENLTKSISIVEDQFRILKMAKEDQDVQLTASKVALEGAHERLSFLQEEVDSSNLLCEELKAKCHVLQIQLESMTKKEIPKNGPEKEEKQHHHDLEITRSSQKLAECQETILNLGRQFQAMASPGDAYLFDKVICTTTDAKTTVSNMKEIKQRISLFDKMLADNAETGYTTSAKTKEIISTSKSPTIYDASSYSKSGVILMIDSHEESNVNGTKHQDREDVHSMAIVPGKKKGIGGLFKKLLWRRKGTSRKLLFTPVA